MAALRVRSLINDPETVYRRRWLTLVVLCFSLIVIGLDNTILNVALPTLVRDLGASASELQWIVDAYTIVFAGLLLTAGSLGDRYGRYKTLVIGLVVFGLGSTASAFSGSAKLLIITRGLMGIGGAFIMPSTLSILTNVFTDHAERGRAIGIWAGISALGIGVGPVTGGFLLSHFWWGSVFLVNVPIIVIGLVAGYFLVPDSHDPAAPRLDPLGSLLSIAGLSAVLWGVIEAPSHGWTSTSIVIAFVLGGLILAAFIGWELTTSSPMLNMHFFQDPRFSVASAAITLTFFALFGSIFLLTQYFQVVLGYSPIKAGATLLPQAGVLMIVAATSSTFVQRVGHKVVIAVGLLLVALALLLATTLTSTSSWLHVVGVTLVLALGMGNVMAPATDSIMGSLPLEKAGVGSAVNDTTRQVGGALGVAVLGSVLASRYRSHITSSLGHQGVPSNIISAVKDNVGAAVAFARSLPGNLAAVIVRAADNAFVSGMHVAQVVAACVVALAALAVALWLPARPLDEAPQSATSVETDAGRARRPDSGARPTQPADARAR